MADGGIYKLIMILEDHFLAKSVNLFKHCIKKYIHTYIHK